MDQLVLLRKAIVNMTHVLEKHIMQLSTYVSKTVSIVGTATATTTVTGDSSHFVEG